LTALEFALLFRADSAPVVREAAKGGSALDRFGEKIKGLQDKLKKLAQEGQTQLTGGAASLFGMKRAFLDPFAEAENAGLELRNTFAGLDSEGPYFQSILRQTRELGAILPGSESDIARFASRLGQLNISAETVANGGLSAVAHLGVTLGKDYSEMAEYIAGAIHGFGVAQTDLLALADYTQRFQFKLGLDPTADFKEAMQYAGPSMRALNQEGLEGVKTFGLMEGMLKANGVQASKIGTGMQELIQGMATAQEKVKHGRGFLAQEAAEVLARNKISLQLFNGKGQFVGWPQAIGELEKLKRLSQREMILVTEKLFGSNAGGIAIALAKSGVQGWNEAALRFLDTSTLDRKMDDRAKTFAFKLEALKGTLRQTGGDIGKSLGESVGPLLDKLNIIVSKVGEWAKANPRLTATILTSVGGLMALNLAGGALKFVIGNALGPLGSMARGLGATYRGLKTVYEWSTLAGGPLKGLTTYLSYGSPVMQKLGSILSFDLTAGLKALRSGFLGLLPGLWGAITATWAWTVALLANPITWIVVGIVALVAAGIALWKNWDKVTAWFKSAWSWFTGLWSKVPGWAKLFMPFIAIPMAIIQNWDKIKAGLSALWNWIKGFFGNMLEAGSNLVKMIAKGMLMAAMHPVEAIKAVVTKVRKYLPFSPAKEGPLTDIHKIRLVETIADSLSPAALVGKLGSILGAARSVVSKGLTLGASIAAPALAPGAQGRSILIQIQVDARGAAPGVQQDVERAIMKAAPALKRELERLQANDSRRKF
jgi:TP901 family phage tail tape measure protein